MEYNDLIKLKKEVDELSLYYHALKNREEELKEILYSNNILDSGTDDKKNREEDINKYISQNKIRYIAKSMVIYIGIYTIILILKDAGISNLLYNILVGCNLSNYSCHVLFYESIARKKYEKKHKKTTIDIDEVKKEYERVENKIEEIKKKLYEKSLEYDSLVGELNKDDYCEYLEYLNNYLYEMLEDSTDRLSEAELMVANESDDELEMSPSLVTDDDYTLHLN